MSSTRVLCWHHKYGPRLYLADTEERLHAAAVAIVREEVRDRWFDEEDESEAVAILKQPPKAVWQWVRSRQGYEYEATELLQAEDPMETERTEREGEGDASPQE